MSTRTHARGQAASEQADTPVQTGLLQRRHTEQAESATLPDEEERQRSPDQSLDSATPRFRESRFNHDFSQVPVHSTAPPIIQTKLTIGQPGDRYEQEADRVAEAVMRMPERGAIAASAPPQGAIASSTASSAIAKATISGSINPLSIQHVSRGSEEKLQQQRMEEEENEPEEEEDTLQAKEFTGQTRSVPVQWEDRFNARKGNGLSLPESVRTFMEPRFGYDFSQVRVHSDPQANRLASELNAKAFTQGKDIFFGSGYYQPHTKAGQQLLAHELTHVVQQAGTEAKPPGTQEGKSQSATPTIQPQIADETPKIQRMCSECAEEEKLQRQPLQGDNSLPAEVNETPHTVKTKPITPIPAGDNTVQAFDLGIGDALGDAADWVGGQVSAGAEWAGDQAENLLELGADAFMAIIERLAPGLAELIRNGPEGWLSEKIGTGIRDWLQGLLGNVDIGSAITNLQSSLAGVFANIQGVIEGDEASCAAFAEALNSLQELAATLMDNPAVQMLQEAFAQVSSVFQQVSDLVLAPIFDALMEVAGGVFDQVMDLASQLWEWGGAVRNFLSDAWNWVLEQLGIGGDSEGGILEWLKAQASAVWSQIKETFAPVIEPLRTILTVMVAFSPAGPFLAIVTYGPQLIEAVQWLWNNKDNPDIVKAAHEEMGNTILPQLLSAAQGFSETLNSAVTGFVEQVVQLGQGVLELLGAVSGVPLLSVVQNLVQVISNGIQELVTWSQETFQGVSESVQNLFTQIKAKIEPYAGVLSSLALAIVNPAMIPVILAGTAWRLLPDCYKPPIINFLLDTVIGLLEAAPSLPMFGLLWPMLKAGVIGFLQGVRNQDDETKVAITNKLATIISGGSPAFIWGFVKGILKGIWEGLTDPFVLIYEAIKGVRNLVTWLNDVANQALSSTTKSASPETGTPSAASANQVEMGQRMQQMAGELQPPVEQVTQGFIPAMQELFSGGEGMSFEELMQKLGDTWAAVETAISNAGGTLAQKVCEFLMQDSAEGEMGEAVGWLAGTIAFEVVLGILTAGSWTAAKGAMKGLKLFAKVLDWTGEVMGLAFKGLAKVGGFILDGIKGLGKLLSNAGGAAKAILDALGDIGRKLIDFADELLGLAGKAGKGAAGEVAEEATEKAAKEAAEAGAEKAAKEVAEEGAEKATKEAAEEGAEKGAKETTDNAAQKAAQLPAAIAQARGITEVNDAVNTPVSALLVALNTTLKPKYSWLERFEARPKGMPGHYSIHMIASDHEIDRDYTTDGGRPTAAKDAAEAEARIKKLEADAKEFEAQLKEASAKARDAQTRTSEAKAIADEANSRAKAAQGRVKEAEVRVNEAEARAKKAEGTVEAESRAKEAAQAREEALKAKQEAAQAREEALKANEELKKAKEAEAKAKQEETEVRQFEAIAREEASLPKQEAIVKQKTNLQANRAVLDKEIEALKADAAKAQKKVDEASRSLPDKRGAEREAARKQLNKLQAERDKISEKLSALSGERAKIDAQIRDLEAKLQAEIRGSRAVPPEIRAKLRDASPNDALRAHVNNPANPQVKIDPVSKQPIDPVYGKPVPQLSPDHVVPLNEIVQMPGFNKLTYEQQLEVVNLKENIMGIDPRVNSAKQDTPWSQFRGHSELGSIDPKIRVQLIQAEKDARAALEKAIKARLPQ